MILTINTSAGSRHIQDEKLKAERETQIKEIFRRGKIAVFTRPHSLLPSIIVIKKVAEWKQDGVTEDLIALNGSYVAWWSDEYKVTEESWDHIGPEGQNIS